MKIFTEDIIIGTCTYVKLKKEILVKGLITLVCLLSVLDHTTVIAAAKEVVSAEEYLVKTGMSMQEIDTLDEDARQFIADDLKNSGEKDWKLNTDILTLTSTSSKEYTVAFYINVFAFRAGSDHRIYAVYESSTEIMPTGNDSLTMHLGAGFDPYEYGGRIWYKKAGDGSWVQGGGLTADHQTPEGGVFTGRQLGNFQKKMLVKGCVYCYAGQGEGSEAKVMIDYAYNPPKERNETGLYILIVAVTVVVVLILRKRE